MTECTGGTAVAGARDLEGVLVLGMHRSGTSMITRLTSLVGPAVCRPDDLVVGSTRNARGHWESQSLIDFNERLLRDLDATWYCPPTLSAPRVQRLLDDFGAEALEVLRAAHPARPWVWKDPRACVLAPFWSELLRGRVAYIIAARHPLEVSDSLARRNGFTPQLSLALWERYTRESLIGAAGAPAMLCTYDGVLDDPVRWCERLAAFLGGLGMDTAVDPAAVRGFTSSGLRHSERAWGDLGSAELSDAQLALAQAMTATTAVASFAPPLLPQETPQTELIFAQMRALEGGVPDRDALPGNLLDRELARRRPARAQAPEVTLALAGPGEGSLAPLAAGLPADSEVVPFDHRGEVCEQLARRAAAAQGRFVVLGTTAITAVSDGWYEQLVTALGRSRTGAAGPALLESQRARGSSRGRRLVPEDLGLRACRTATSRGRVPLLTEVLCVVERELLVTSGGLDGAFDTPAAAIGELCLRLWRMGFWCNAGSSAQVQSPGGSSTSELGLYDRLRIAGLHLGEERRGELARRLGDEPGYRAAADRLAAGDVETRRAAVGAVCVFSGDDFLEAFPAPRRAQQLRGAAARLARAGGLR